MSVTEELFARLEKLPVVQQMKVLEFVQSLPSDKPRAYPDHMGALKEYASGITFEEIKALRKEMWKSFPRELPK